MSSESEEFRRVCFRKVPKNILEEWIDYRLDDIKDSIFIDTFCNLITQKYNEKTSQLWRYLVQIQHCEKKDAEILKNLENYLEDTINFEVFGLNRNIAKSSADQLAFIAKNATTRLKS
ncbi:hypothetical protein B566_EDAN004152 [Ephemera danica]|nr:hypothetical protein B566_EDAN004152 [Ephemera danica]